MYHADRMGWSEVERVIIVVCMVVGDECCEVGAVMYVKDSDRVKQRVGQGLVLGGVLDGVSPHRAVHADGGGEVGGVLGDRSGRWREPC